MGQVSFCNLVPIRTFHQVRTGEWDAEQLLVVQGRVTFNDGDQGIFECDGKDFTTPDDDLNVIVDLSGNRWKRFLGTTSPVPYVPTIASLRGTPVLSINYVQGYYAPNDGGEGWFAENPNDTTSADNGGTIIVDSNGHRWYRLYNGPISVGWFGAKCDGATDDTGAWGLALALFTSQGAGIKSGTLQVGGMSAISRPLTYAGGPNYNLIIEGVTGGAQGLTGTGLRWIGTVGTTMLIYYGAFDSEIRGMDFDIGLGTGLTNDFHIVADNTYTDALTAPITAGAAVTAHVTSTTNLAAGTAIGIGKGTASFEVVYVISVTGATTFTANFFSNHLSGAVVGAGPGSDGCKARGGSMTVPEGAATSGVLLGNQMSVATPQVSNVLVDSCTFRGHGADGAAYAGIREIGGGNIKCFTFNQNIFYSLAIPIALETSGDTVKISSCQFENTTTTTILANGVTNLNVTGCEDESSHGHRFHAGSTGVNYQHSASFYNCSFEGVAPGDDIIILTGAALTMVGNTWSNTRTGSSLPLISVDGSMFRTATSPKAGSIVSMNNYFLNGGPTSQVFYDSGNPYNIIGWAQHLQVARVTSIGDYGTNGGMPTINGTADARMYGVVGDGVTNDSAALNAAITANLGGTLCVNVNQLLLATPVNLSGPIQLVGLGGGRNNVTNYGTRIFTNNAVNLMNDIIASGGGNDDFGGSITGFVFDGNGHAAIGLDMEGATNVKWLVENCNFINCTNLGTQVLGNHSYRFVNCQWALNGSDAPGDGGILFGGCNASSLFGCNAEANLGHGWIVSAGYVNSWSGGAIEGNHFNGALLKGSAQHVVIESVDFESNGAKKASFTGSIAGTTLTVTAVSAGIIGLGCRIAATGIKNGPYLATDGVTLDGGPTFITALGTGTGGTGTYTVTPTQTLSSRAMTAGYYDVDISTNTQSGVVVQNCKFAGTNTANYVRNQGDQCTLKNLRGITANKMLWTVTAASGLWEGDITLQLDPTSYMASFVKVINTRPLGFNGFSTPAFPANNTLCTNTNNGDVIVYILTPGTVTHVFIYDAQGSFHDIIASLTAAQSFLLPAGWGLKFTYSVAPTWTWGQI